MAALNNVAIFGATGEIGSRIARELLNLKKFNVTLLVRDESKEVLKQLKEAGANTVILNVEDVDALTAALNGIDIVVSAVAGAGIPTQFGLIQAAKKANIKWFIPSEYGVDSQRLNPAPKFFDGKHAVAHALEESGLAFTVFQTGFFVDTTFNPFFGFDFAANKFTLPETLDSPISLTHRDDVAKVIAQAISRPEEFHNQRTVRVAADTVSLNDIIKLYTELTGKTPEVVKLSLAELQATVDASGPNPFGAIQQQFQLILGSGKVFLEPNDIGKFSEIKFVTAREQLAAQLKA